MEELCQHGGGWGQGQGQGVRDQGKGIGGTRGKGLGGTRGKGIRRKGISSTPHSQSIFQHILSHPQEKSLKNQAASTETSCRCQKSKCLLLYCECFSKGLPCNDRCECNKCRNTSQFQCERQIARRSVLQRDPNAFANKLQVVGSEEAKIGHKRGCRYKKTHCLKKYCECFQAGVDCTYLCNCEGCYNGQQEAVFP